MYFKNVNRHFFLFLLAAISFGIYFNSLSNSFVWDDKYSILKNDWIKDVKHLPDIFLSHSLGWLKPEQSSTKYAPLNFVVRLAQYHISGTDPWAYQLTNVLVHVLSTIMVYLIAAKLFCDFYAEKSPWYASAASLLFALHPVHTEPVNWAIGMAELSMTFFCLVSFYLFMHSAGKNFRAQLLPGFFLLIALLFKVSAVFFLFVYAAYDYALEKRGIAKKYELKVSLSILAQRYLPLAGSVLAYALLLFIVTAGEKDPFNASHIRLDKFNLMLNVPRLFLQYMEQLVLPVQLNALYVFHPVTSLAAANFIIPACLTIACFVLLVISIKNDPVLPLASMWVVVPLLPCLYLPATGYSYYVYAERYLYLPSAGYVILIAALSRHAIRKSLLGKQTAAFFVLLMVITGVFFAKTTLERNRVWKDDYSLWADTVIKSPDSDIAHNNLGVAYENQGRLDDALKEYEAAISLNRFYTDAYVNRYRVYKRKESLPGVK